MEMCNLCHHSLENNSHGFDQNDAWMEGYKLVHSGFCSYCKICYPTEKTKNTRGFLPEGCSAGCYDTDYGVAHDIKCPNKEDM